jgi:hypothetical protein
MISSGGRPLKQKTENRDSKKETELALTFSIVLQNRTGSCDKTTVLLLVMVWPRIMFLECNVCPLPQPLTQIWKKKNVWFIFT